MDFRIQQKYVALAFVYWDNRNLVDLLDPIMFWDFWAIISIIKENRTIPEIWRVGLQQGCMDEMIECDLDVALFFRHNCGIELLRLWEEWIDKEFKKTSKKLNHEATKKINNLYETLKKRLESQDEDTIMQEAQKYITMSQEKSGVRTWLVWLDKHIGWLRSGTVTRLSGYSNVGKSRFMYAVLANILKQWKSVHVFSLEVPKGMILINLVGAYYGLNTGNVENGSHPDKLQEFYEKFKNSCLIEDDKISLDQIEASIVHNDKDVVFIDYVQNIRSQWKDEYEKMTRIAQEIQKMAISTGKPFFDLSQVSNEWTRYKVGDMIPSKGSGAFVFACDIGLVLYRWDDARQIKLSLAKNKFWQKDIEYVLEPDMWKCSFKFLADNTLW